jgi:hypothetical protein
MVSWWSRETMDTRSDDWSVGVGLRVRLDRVPGKSAHDRKPRDVEPGFVPAGFVSGYVRDDAGNGLAGVSLVLHSAAGAHTATTDSSGKFHFSGESGDCELGVVAESIPAGYDTSALAPQVFHLDTEEPAHVDIAVTANRSIAGTVRSAPGADATVTLLELQRNGTVDAAGRYVFRGLPPGTYTVQLSVGGKVIQRVVTMPAAPTTIRDIDFP